MSRGMHHEVRHTKHEWVYTAGVEAHTEWRHTPSGGMHRVEAHTEWRPTPRGAYGRTWPRPKQGHTLTLALNRNEETRLYTQF